MNDVQDRLIQDRLLLKLAKTGAILQWGSAIRVSRVNYPGEFQGGHENKVYR